MGLGSVRVWVRVWVRFRVRVRVCEAVISCSGWGFWVRARFRVCRFGSGLRSGVRLGSGLGLGLGSGSGLGLGLGLGLGFDVVLLRGAPG